MSVLTLDHHDASELALSRDREVPPSMIERMTLILDAFRSPSARLTLEEVARTTHLPRSTAHRILDQLVGQEWLSHSASGYGLGGRALGLGGGSGGDTRELRTAAASALHQLQVRTGLVVHLAILDGPEVRYLDKVGGRFVVSVPSRVGGSAPAHRTALGKAMLAWLDAEEVDATVGRALEGGPRRGISDLPTLHQELHRIRERHGLAFEVGESFPDIACVAAAVRGPERPLGAVSLVGHRDVALEKVAPLVAAAARHISHALHPELDSAGPRRSTRQRIAPVCSTRTAWS